MERPVIRVLILLIFSLTPAVWAQPAPVDPPAEGSPGPEGRVNPEHAQRRRMPGQGLLMASDERFQKMLLLTRTPPDQVQQKLQEWPEYQKMDPQQREKLAKGLEMFRQHITRTALDDAQKLGLTIPPEKEADYIKAYWDKRIAAEMPIRREVEAKLKAARQAIDAELKKEYGGK